MSYRTPIPLKPALIELDAPEITEICAWQFADATSYVGRILRTDIPQRIQYGGGRIWIYRNPQDQLVGFGTIDLCDDWGEFTAGQHHPYIPLLAVNPTIKSLGYGTSIVRHLRARVKIS
jgi:hypothetical protein